MRSKPYIETDNPPIEPFPSREEWEAMFTIPYPETAAYHWPEEPMKERNLSISGELWVEMLKGGSPKNFRVVKNALPEDAKCVGIDWQRWPGVEGPVTIVLKIASSVFQDGDPVDLPSPVFKSINSD